MHLYGLKVNARARPQCRSQSRFKESENEAFFVFSSFCSIEEKKKKIGSVMAKPWIGLINTNFHYLSQIIY